MIEHGALLWRGPLLLRGGSGNFGRHEPIESHMMKPTLRPAAAADIAAITAIYRPAVLTGTASFELVPPDEAEMLRRFEAVKQGGYPYFVAEIDGHIVGYAYANAYRTRPAYRFTVENSVYVAREWRGLGVGRRLLTALLEAAIALGHHSVVARITGDNVVSRRLHESLGFRLVGIEEEIAMKFGRWVDVAVYQRRF